MRARVTWWAIQLAHLGGLLWLVRLVVHALGIPHPEGLL